MFEKYYIIYKITNILNGKIYIGAHETNNIYDDYLGSGKALKAAIKKYGREHFKKEILSQHPCRDTMYAEETRLVNEDFVARTDNYNLRIGGPGNFHYINTNGLNNQNGQNLKASAKHQELMKTNLDYREKYSESRRKVSKRMIEDGTFPSFLNKVHSESTKKKISELSKISQAGTRNSQYGKVWVHNIELKQNKTIKKEFLDETLRLGWIKGRKNEFYKPSLV